MAQSSVAGRRPAVLVNPWLIGGIAGIGFVVLFVAGAVVVQGNTPNYDDSIADIRKYWTDSSNRYLVGDWLTAVAFLFFFLPFLSALRSVLGPADPSGGVWARYAFAGGLAFLVLGGAGSAVSGALALTEAKDIDDSTLRLAMDLSDYAFTTVTLAAAAFLVPASLVMLVSGVLWRWLGILGLAASALVVAGALWVLSGDQMGPLGALSLIGFIALGIWIVATSVCMLMRRTRLLVA